MIAFIPVRGGSKGIPQKNIKIMAGKPLVYWAIDAAIACASIKRVYVSTDCEKIAAILNVYRSSKLKVIGRPSETATDTATTEAAMIDFAVKYQPKSIILIQATSPLITGKDLLEGIETYQRLSADSLVSVARQKRFRWDLSDINSVKPLNYCPQHRPRRQEFAGEYIENGAFYISNTDMLLQTNSRLHGKIVASIMDESSLIEIDDETDWVVAETLLKKRQSSFYPKQKLPIKLFLTDVDGVLTDSGMYYTESGDEVKKFNTRDGVGLKLLQDNGIKVGIITGENTKIVENRAKKLGIDYLLQGCQNKLEAVKKLAGQLNILLEEIAFIGDDINDLNLINAVGCSACPSDARQEIFSVAANKMQCKGGEGAVREFAQIIIDRKNAVE